MLADNLRLLRKAKGYNQERIANLLGVKTHTYGAYERGDNRPPIDKLLTLSDLFGISLDEMVKSRIDPATGMPIGQDDVNPVVLERFTSVPIVPYRVLAGYLTQSHSPDYFDGLEKLLIPKQGTGYNKDMMAFEVSGDSMLPRIQQGDFVICRQFPTDGNLIRYEGKVFVVITHREDFLVKRLLKFDPLEKKGIFKSDNPMYEDIELDFVSDVQQIWKVEKIFGSEL